ncbi:M-phase phosphoprotein 8-like isoform X1 [Sinocyclocheilus anshuiensis]|uniref:M-phase phosphoprotein 8-like isoform X1 n=1 Tax=Sinocyclocheilus anshuiensis TaxID=1608454 RepID=UPI0007B85769|nr:PREDICTED: M-phase phosphoprotein 8-like isoform X1 [Sinocyclocheilus anshuiensis]
MTTGAERAEPGDSEQDEEDVYEVERIIDTRVVEGEVLYRVRWKNYSSDDDTWEPEAHLDDCREVLLAYKKALAEMKPKKETGMKLPMKSDLFDADSESDGDKEKQKESPIKKKKKKKKVEESDDEMPVKEKKKKKKKEKWWEDKPLPAPESDEEEAESRDPSPAPPKKETKKRLIDSDDDDAPVTPKKQKKLDKHKDGGKQKKESGEDCKKKKVKSKKEIDTSDEEDEKSDVPSESHTDDTTNTETNDSFKTMTAKTTDKSARSESGGDLKQAKQKKAKSDLKLQGFKDLIQEKKPKKVEVSTATSKESGANKHKSFTSSKSTSKSSRSEEEPDSSDTGAATSAPKSKVKSKGQEAGPPSQKLSSASSSSSSSTASTAPIKPKEEEPKEEVGEKGGASNLFEKFLLNCEAKDRVPRRQADQNKNITPKGAGKNDKKTKLSKQSPARKPDSDKTEKAKDVPRPGQSPFSMEIDEKQEKGTSEKSDKSDELAPKSKEELQREQREEEQRKRKEKMEEEERKRKERIEEEERKKKERIEEAQRERKARMEEAQRLAEEARQERLERKSMTESIASPDSTEDSRWKDKRRKRRDDSESRVFTACNDNQDSQETMERSDKTPDRGPPSLNLGVELKLDWMTLEDFQKHLNGEDENLSPLALTPAELREAVKNGNYLAVKRALSSKEDYNLDQEDSSGMSLTLLAAAGGQDDVLRLLIKKGVKVNARQKNGTTALMHAAEKNFLTTVAILLEAGSSVNAQTLGGETALMKACKRGNADVVRLLLEYGADCNILSKHKNTALYYAKLSNNLMIYDLIKDHMQTLSTVAEETIRAYFETRLALLEPVFPLACHRLCEGPDFSLEFNYKPPQHTPGEGSGILLFIFHANFLNEITARLCGPCSVHAVVLNDKFQLPIFLDSHFIYSFSPVQGTNKLFIRLAESPTAKVKLLICAYRVQLQ